jgi:hypothetical protein
MTIGVNNRNDAVGNGTTPTYTYGFKIFASTDLRVTVRDPANDEETTLTYPTHYSVSGVGLAAGGSITLTNGAYAWEDASGFLDDEWAISIRRVRPLTQETDFRNQDRSYLLQNSEDQFDRCLMVDQQQQDEIDRSLKLGETATDISTTIENWAAGRYIRVNGDATAIEAVAAVNDPGSYTASYTGAVSRNITGVLDDYVSVLSFIPENLHSQIKAGSYTGNLSAYLQDAVDTGKRLYWPAGTYYGNVIVANPTVWIGDGTTATTIKPYSASSAIVTYRLTNGGAQWSYHTTIENIGFDGLGGDPYGAGSYSDKQLAGVGFTFSATDPSTAKVTGYDLVGYVTFRNCRFRFFFKGVQRPYGNLGVHLDDCAFSSCYYGTYSAQGKGIPPGQFFVTRGQSDTCVCAHYIDARGEALSGISFDGHVFEANSIAVRCKAPASTQANNPVMFRNCHNESNGVVFHTLQTAVTLDVWSGSGAGAAVSTETVSTVYPFIFDVDEIAFDGGFVSGINLKGANQVCVVKNARVEQTTDYNASPFLVDNPATSIVAFDGCFSISGLGNLDDGCREIGPNFNTSRDDEATNAQGRGHNLPHCFPRTFGVSNGLNQAFETAKAVDDGSSHAGVVSSAGVVGAFNVSNEFTGYSSTAGSVFGNVSGTSYAASNGNYIVATVAVNVVAAGNLSFAVWDGVDQYVFIKKPPVDGRWRTYGGIAKMSAGATLKLAVLTEDGAPVALDYYIGQFQIKEFTTWQEAHEFLYSHTYAVTQASSVGEASGFTAGAGTAMKADSTSTGNAGTKAYTFGDVVKHLKAAGILATS